MLKKDKVIKLESQKDRDFWLAEGSEKAEKPKKKPKPAPPKKKAKKKAPKMKKGFFFKRKKEKKKEEKPEKKETKTKIEALAAKTAEEANVHTVFDRMYNILEEKKSVSVDELGRKLGISRGKVLELALTFEESGKADIEYPLFGSPKLVLKEKGELSE